MSFCRRLLVLASLTTVAAAGLPAMSAAGGGPCAPSTPQYCPPPKVRTGPAKDVTSVAATLTGTVTPNGSDTTCSFEYGRTKAYGSTTQSQNVGSGSKDVNVSAKVDGLAPKTTYHYQLTCENLGGSGDGGDRKFMTDGVPGGPPAATTERAGRHTSTAAIFRGTVNPNGSATSCSFRYGRTTGYGSRTPVQRVGSGRRATTVTTRVEGLAPKTVYHFRLFCSNAAGRSRGGDRRVETRNQIRFRGSRTILVSRRGRFTVGLHCNGNHRCVGHLTLAGRGGTRLAGRVRYAVGPHTTKRIRMRLTPGALGQLSQRHHLSGRLRARNLDGSSAARRVKLRER